ncbi:SDR family oxidoreductase [Actinomadura chibensis]|uniref:SDR family oxidoreductase n=1 Tax=Actinomadura chibensis TaxID=392828 RepID=A0A5D0NKG3_9ACTN|nr:SDR family oxidoreductase [Actinomadura chibensis]TYB44970.1 SDR family oxidoreductase [Actinomadura chibensis]
MTGETIVLITGANRGVGRAAARRLAERGATVLLGSRDLGRGEKAAEALRADGGDVRALRLDVTDAATIEAAARRIDERFGRLDVLVNNAGISGSPGPTAPATADLNLVRRVFETNVFGVIAVTNAMLPLLSRSAAARIVNVSSGVGSLSFMTDPDHPMSRLPGHAAYPPSKTALNSLTVQYAKDLRERGILINACTPGACATDFTRHLGLPLTRTADDGAAIVVRLATLAPDGPTGGFFDDDGAVPW